jgi:hypothetical protein
MERLYMKIEILKEINKEKEHELQKANKEICELQIRLAHHDQTLLRAKEKNYEEFEKVNKELE